MDEPLRVFGYHGTSISSAKQILSEGYQLSRNGYDWLGDGVYFWQDAPKRAWAWALDQHDGNAAVLRSTIRLEDCIDLFDSAWAEVLRDLIPAFQLHIEQTSSSLPSQKSGAHWLDCSFINYAVGYLAGQGMMIKGVRAPFREGSPILPQSDLYDLGHIQIAVRDLSLIETTVMMKREGGIEQ